MIYAAESKNDKNDGFPKGQWIPCFVARMSDGRVCIYNSIGVEKRMPSGYMVYSSIEEMEEDFILYRSDSFSKLQKQEQSEGFESWMKSRKSKLEKA